METVGGDLTIKVENNTDSGTGIYSEPADDPDQILDDADILYACIENIILLKINKHNLTLREFRELTLRRFDAPHRLSYEGQI